MTTARPAGDSTQRFSDRVAAYVAGRPHYPAAVVAELERRGALRPGATVADIGVGTGLSAEPFLKAGYRVIGVEPNAPMREAGAEYLAAYPGYTARDGTAEATGIEASGVDLVIAGQAFHWFDAAKFRTEALRMLRPGGWAALIWNDRDRDGTPFLAAYEALLVEYGNDYLAIRHGHESGDIAAFFGGHVPPPVRIEHSRRLDWPTLSAMAGSASYLPAPGQPRHDAFVAALRALFDREASAGTIEMRYRCRIHAAPL